MINRILNVLVFFLWIACVVPSALLAILWLSTGYPVLLVWSLFADAPVPAGASPLRLMYWTQHIQALAPMHRGEIIKPTATPAPTPQPQLTSGQSTVTTQHDHSPLVYLLQADFDALPEYSTSVPTGVRPGKQWKHHNPRTGEWHRCTYTPTDNPDAVRITWERIVVHTPFIQRVLNGTATPDDVDDHIDMWHDLPVATAMPLATWLGMTDWEYAAFVRSHANLTSIIEARKAKPA